MADEPENLVLELLRRLDSKVERLDGKVERIAAEKAAIKTEHRTQSRTLGILLQEGRLLRAAINDIA